jgi:hypothetical protein
MPRSKMDPSQISQITFDEQLEATRVYMLPTEMEMELNADDGDSILTQKQMQVIQAEAGQLIDTSKASRMSITSESEVLMCIDELEISLGTLTPGQVKEICTPAIKLAVACTLILQS